MDSSLSSVNLLILRAVFLRGLGHPHKRVFRIDVFYGARAIPTNVFGIDVFYRARAITTNVFRTDVFYGAHKRV